jgi:hypothetical protein
MSKQGLQVNFILTYIDEKIGLVFSRIQCAVEVPLWHASIARIIFGFFILAFSTVYSGWLRDTPDGFYNPPYYSLGRLFSGFAPDFVISIFDILIVVSLVCIVLGIRARMACFLFAFLFVALSLFNYSVGKIGHPIMVPIAAICLGFSNGGIRNALLPDKKWPFHAQSFAILGIVLSFAMFTAGFIKLLSWIDFDLSTNGFLSWFYHGYFSLGRQGLFADIVFSFPPILSEIMDYSAVLFELTPFICLLIGPRSWRFWLTMACFFHLINTLLLNIPFTAHFAIYPIFFIYPLFQEHKLNTRRAFKIAIKVIFVLAILMGFIRIIFRMQSAGSYFLFVKIHPSQSDIVLWASCLIWGLLALLGMCNLMAWFRTSDNQ